MLLGAPVASPSQVPTLRSRGAFRQDSEEMAISNCLAACASRSRADGPTERAKSQPTRRAAFVRASLLSNSAVHTLRFRRASRQDSEERKQRVATDATLVLLLHTGRCTAPIACPYCLVRPPGSSLTRSLPWHAEEKSVACCRTGWNRVQ